MVAVEPPFEVTYRGRVYRRYPASPHRNHRVYYQATGPGAGVAEPLHRQVYLDHHGPIPDGWHVHHQDHDPFNNAPDNLVVATNSEHLAHHMAGYVADDGQLAHLDRVRPLASEWHRSDDGRAWHREHGVRTWEGRPLVEHRCQLCGETFETRGKINAYCSARCRNWAFEHDPKYMVDATCAECDGPFQWHKHKRVKRFCGRDCAARGSGRERRERRRLQSGGAGAA